MMIDEGGPLSRKGDSSASSDGKTDGARFAGLKTSVISEGHGRLALDGGGLLAGISCSTAGGDCATIAREDPVETDACRERGGVFGLGGPKDVGSLPALVDFLDDAGVWVFPSVESTLPVFLEGPDVSRRSRAPVRRRLGVPWKAVK
jgi:hypothetical protein